MMSSRRSLEERPQVQPSHTVFLSSKRRVFHQGLVSQLVCVVLVLIALIGCHQGKQRVIAVVPKGQAHIFWQTVHAGAKAAGDKFGVTILWNGPALEIEISKQINILEDLINRREDGIVVAPSDQKALVPVIESATRRGIPVTIFDSGAQTES